MAFYDGYMGWEGYNPEYWGYDFGAYQYKASTTYGSYAKKPMTREDMVDNSIKWIRRSIDDNVVYIEPHVRIKFMHMMAIAGGEEVFGKLVIQPEHGYLVVKDCVIPYQVVSGAHFIADEDMLNKWMFEIQFENNDPMKDDEGKPQGIRRTTEQVNEISSRMLGHFHSHNSVNSTTKPTPSGTDTTDMQIQLDNHPYWLEIIGTMGKENVGLFSGRVLVKIPKGPPIKVEVKEKWWHGIDRTITEADGKISTRSWQSNYSNNNKKKETNKTNSTKKNKYNFPLDKCPIHNDSICKHEICCLKCNEKHCKSRCPLGMECPYIQQSFIDKALEEKDRKDVLEMSNDEIMKALADKDGVVNVTMPSGEVIPKQLSALEPLEIALIINRYKRDQLKAMKQSTLSDDLSDDDEDIDYSKRVPHVPVIPVVKELLNPAYAGGNIWRSEETRLNTICLDWRVDDPVLVPRKYLPDEYQAIIGATFEQALLEGEKIVIEICDDNYIDLQIYDKETDEYKNNLFTIMQTIMEAELSTMIKMLERHKIDEDFLFVMDDEWNQLPRTMSYDYALKLMGADPADKYEIVEYEGNPDEEELIRKLLVEEDELIEGALTEEDVDRIRDEVEKELGEDENLSDRERKEAIKQLNDMESVVDKQW